MNDQPKPIGEWNRRFVQDLCTLTISDYDAEEIADTHNAAGEIQQLREQLAAERENVQTLVDALKRAEGAIRSEDHVKMGLALVVIRDRLAKVKEGK